MGRCGCNSGCACAITAGTGTTVTGTGTAGNPFVVSATPSSGSDTIVTVLDTVTVNMTVTGTGTLADPYIVSADLTNIENVNTVAASGAAQTLPNVGVATIHRITLTANCTLTFPAAAAGKSFTVVLVQDATGSRTVTWPGTVLWPSGTAPTLTTTAAKRDVISFMCADGANWLGFVAGQNF